MRKYIFPIIKKQKEQDEQKRGVRIPLHKEAVFDIEPPKEKSPELGDDPNVDFNIDDKDNIINNTLRL